MIDAMPTAKIHKYGVELIAQADGESAESLMARLIADDDIWVGADVYEAPMMERARFSPKGLAITCTKAT